MAGSGASPAWLADQRTELATDRILDAAEELFAQGDPGSVGMHEIARVAGCSRATLYRYFESREALYGAYVHRWANELHGRLTESLSGIDNPRERLITGITESMALVRANPALASWFTETGPPIGAAMAERSEVVTAMVASFVASLGAESPAAVERRARWVVRAMTSLLIFPGRDAADEHAMLEEFVVPVVAPRTKPAASRRA